MKILTFNVGVGMLQVDGIPEVTRVVSDETSSDDASSCNSYHTALETPLTPEGLKPRKPIEIIRKELNLPIDFPFSSHSFPSREPSPYSRQDYSHSTLSRVAESPDIFMNPTTAVGALVAQQTAMQPHSTIPKLPQLPPRHPAVLPPRSWMHDDLPYQKLSDSYDVGTPNRPSHLSNNSSPTSTQASSIQSPAWRYQEFSPDEEHSQVGLVEDLDRRTAYNFDPIDRDVVTSDALTNVSAMSGSTHGDEIHSLESRLGRTQTRHYYDFDEEAVDDIAIQRKRSNQRKQREDLMLQVMERLQDDVDFIHQVERLGSNERNSSRTKTPPNKEGIMTGYSTQTRSRLLKYCRSLLHEMNTAQPEEFFLSPTQFENFGETHNDLQKAIEFLVKIIRPNTDNRTWKCKHEVKVAMGIQPKAPESPEAVRGGDTSLFSLPSESSLTPHTSNVSIATTITTRLLSPLRSSPRKAAKVRRTVELVSGIAQCMTVACQQMLKEGEHVHGTEEIKRCYFQLMTIHSDELTNLIDVFFPNATLIRTVSSDSHVEEQKKNLLQVFNNYDHSNIVPCG